MAKDDFDAMKAIKEVEEANDGIKFDNKIKESICRSIPIQDEIRTVLWKLAKEKIGWLVAGAATFVILAVIKELLSKLIEKI